MQKCPPLQLHSPALAGAISDDPLSINPRASLDDPPISAAQFFLLALTEPSLQIKVLPWQWDIPPLLPLHGQLAATVSWAPAIASSAA